MPLIETVAYGVVTVSKHDLGRCQLVGGNFFWGALFVY